MAADDWIFGVEPERDYGDEEDVPLVAFDDVVILDERPAALLVNIDGPRTWWVPRSQVWNDAPWVEPIGCRGFANKKGERGTIYVSAWWAEQKERGDAEEE